MTQVLLVGNPNCGKTTLFNALTGENQHVGNWPGVTVEKKMGISRIGHQNIEIIDIPGVYSLVSSKDAAQDEQITAKAVAYSKADLIINVVDACHLERHLYLTSQLLELGKPVIIAVNMMDIAKQRGIRIDIERMIQQLNCPVIALQAHRGIGLKALRECLVSSLSPARPLSLVLSSEMQQALIALEKHFTEREESPFLAKYLARRVMEGDTFLVHSAIEKQWIPQDADIFMADARYTTVHQLVALIQQKHADASEHLTAKIDRIVLHRFWGLPIFLVVMYTMFLFSINVGGIFQDFFNLSTDAIFVQGFAQVLQQWHMPTWLIVLCAHGIGKGINTTLTFIPVIASMFFFLSWLELSGYMARAAFVIDKIMRLLGLPGKAFVPMIVGFGCNVPAIMAARTLDSERDRFLTVLMSPFMSCSARLAIYAVFVAAFFPIGGHNIVFSLYVIGILVAVITGFVLRKSLLKGEAAPLVMELPAYHQPSVRRLVKDTAFRLRYFIYRAGKLIIPVCLILGALNALTLQGTISLADASQDTLLSQIGQWLTPLFYPMGIQQNNWPATVGLLTGMLAKEVVIGSLNTLYAQTGGMVENMTASGFHFGAAMQEALMSIPQNIAQLGHAITNPILASAPVRTLSQPVYGIMAHQFGSRASAYAYLLFVALYIPCVSTMAVIRQETKKQLMWFSIGWSLLVAYTIAVLFYQISTIYLHPVQTMVWSVSMLSILTFIFIIIYSHSKHRGETYVTRHS